MPYLVVFEAFDREDGKLVKECSTTEEAKQIVKAWREDYKKSYPYRVFNCWVYAVTMKFPI